jgi:hypothetical protein
LISLLGEGRRNSLLFKRPLLEQGLIHSYEKEDGLHGLKFIIHRLKKDQPNMDVIQ